VFKLNIDIRHKNIEINEDIKQSNHFSSFLTNNASCTFAISLIVEIKFYFYSLKFLVPLFVDGVFLFYQ
jgi:uncharacterized membrane protein